MKNRAEAIGLIAGACTTFSFVPQVFDLWKMSPKAAPDVSLITFIVISIGTALWILYGYLIKSVAVKLWNIITLVLTVAILVYKLKYG